MKSGQHAVDSVSGCWVWLLHVSPRHGYGELYADGKKKRAHRVYYEHFKGPIPPDLEIDHLCRNKVCVNPDHLEAVTHRENLRRGESPSAKNARKTHCIRGHEFTSEDTYVTPRGARKCRVCKRAAKVRRRREGLEP